MNNGNQVLKQYDEWLKDDSQVAALVMRQILVSIEGKDVVVFPPTYALEGRGKESGYNIDTLKNGTSVCQLDSVGSQANRMEPIFKSGEYSNLVPQIVICATPNTKKKTKAEKPDIKKVNLLDAGHRAADAIVRFSDHGEAIKKAFESMKNGNAEPMCRIAPTALVFGVWDSRDTQVKSPRIIRSIIRAYGGVQISRSAQYIPALDYVGEGILPDKPQKSVKSQTGQDDKDPMSQLGFNHVPSTLKLGGLQMFEGSEIRREASVNLVALRALRGPRNANAVENDMKLRRYLLGLALVAITAPQDGFLREGCQLVPDTEHPSKWSLVKYDGSKDECVFTSESVLEYAKAAAKELSIEKTQEWEFNAKTAREELEKKPSKNDKASDDEEAQS